MVTEIQIFEIVLKEQVIPERVLKVIDRSIPYQILYKFQHKDSFAWGITLKEGNKAENYYFSEWDQPVLFDFTGIDLEKVYQKLVKAFIDAGTETKKDFNELVANDASKKQLQAEIAALDKKIKQEKQFNRKVDLNKTFDEKLSEFQKKYISHDDYLKIFQNTRNLINDLKYIQSHFERTKKSPYKIS